MPPQALDDQSADRPDRSAARELIVVGDTHDQWDAVDRTFVEGRGAAAVLFVGDFADEDAATIERIAAVGCLKAVVLGNHDAWNASRGRGVSVVEAMLRTLGDDHVAYRAKPLGDDLAVIGARPFSWGGPWGQWSRLYSALAMPTTDEASATAMLRAAATVPGTALVLVAHNGPTGLGDTADAPFGRDFRRPAIDWGDSDLRLAIDRLRDEGREVRLVVAGHMHHRLRGGGERQRTAREDETLYVNAAVVPRHVEEGGGRLRHFVRVRLTASAVVSVEDIWVGDDARIVRTESLPI